LALKASLEAIKNAELNPQDIDTIIVSTTTPDLVFPSTAVILQGKLGISRNCFAFDIQAVCSGFVYAVDLADSLIKSGKSKNVLVASAETFSRILDWTDRTTCVLFGDGAGAVVLQATEEENSGIVYSKIASEANIDALRTNGGVSVGLDNVFVTMQGREVFKIAVHKMCESVVDCAEKLGINTNDVGIVIAHQANQRILDAVENRLGFPTGKFHSTIAKHGNTGSASIPLALYDAYKMGKINRGDVVIFEALGGGLTWGAVALRW
jgi:3-oxoacyl-[acyl-carrier-protein] synthase-3